MARNRNQQARPQRRKTYTRLGASRVQRGIDTGTYVGGLESRISTPVNVNE